MACSSSGLASGKFSAAASECCTTADEPPLLWRSFSVMPRERPGSGDLLPSCGPPDHAVTLGFAVLSDGELGSMLPVICCCVEEPPLVMLPAVDALDGRLRAASAEMPSITVCACGRQAEQAESNYRGELKTQYPSNSQAGCASTRGDHGEKQSIPPPHWSDNRLTS